MGRDIKAARTVTVRAVLFRRKATNAGKRSAPTDYSKAQPRREQRDRRQGSAATAQERTATEQRNTPHICATEEGRRGVWR